MPRRKGAKKREKSENQSIAAGKRKRKNLKEKHLPLLEDAKERERRLRKQRRNDEIRARERQYKRDQRAKMGLKKLIETRERATLLQRLRRSNMTIEELMQARERERLRKQIERSQKGTSVKKEASDIEAMPDNNDEIENNTDDLLLVPLALKMEEEYDIDISTTVTTT